METRVSYQDGVGVWQEFSMTRNSAEWAPLLKSLGTTLMGGWATASFEQHSMWHQRYTQLIVEW